MKYTVVQPVVQRVVRCGKPRCVYSVSETALAEVAECLWLNYTTSLLHPFNGLFSGINTLSRYQKGKTSLDLNEARDDGFCDGSGIS